MPPVQPVDMKSMAQQVNAYHFMCGQCWRGGGYIQTDWIVHHTAALWRRWHQIKEEVHCFILARPPDTHTHTQRGKDLRDPIGILYSAPTCLAQSRRKGTYTCAHTVSTRQIMTLFDGGKMNQFSALISNFACPSLHFKSQTGSERGGLATKFKSPVKHRMPTFPRSCWRKWDKVGPMRCAAGALASESHA